MNVTDSKDNSVIFCSVFCPEELLYNFYWKENSVRSYHALNVFFLKVLSNEMDLAESRFIR